eukprot:TRINITY_DN1098_c0_g1_i3.p1 TRINITY_DN1098_c0_g1~~TRINITY_DN1098_c0_g1_i3.p1  ORF type:complete len:152 (-),score=40.71 TRINITY_DN1098_c0_g1_i3:120-575(-)
MPCLRLFLCSLAVFALDAFELGERELAEAALLQDDLCDADDETCSLKLLQRRAHIHGSKEEETNGDEEGLNVKDGLLQQDVKGQDLDQVLQEKGSSRDRIECDSLHGEIEKDGKCVCDRALGYVWEDIVKKCVIDGLLQKDVKDEDVEQVL